MSASEKVRAWRERLRDAGKVPVTLWLDAATKARLEDLALQQRRSPSDLSQEALDAYRPGSPQVSATITDIQQIQGLVQQELTQGTETLTALVTRKVTDIVTETIMARLPALVQETVQTALAAQGSARPTAPHAQPLSITDIITDTATDTTTPLFDETRYFLGELCRKGHAYHATGQSLRRLSDNECLECHRARASAYRQRKRQAQPA